jgi:hypothetical protein
MRRFVTDDGRTFLIPGDAQERPREPVERSVASGFYACECHEKMGNDFYFLPAKSCLRADKQCTKPNWSKCACGETGVTPCKVTGTNQHMITERLPREHWNDPVCQRCCDDQCQAAFRALPERAADGNSYRYHATGLPAGGDKP